jgi:hypothetical protein
MHRSSDQIGAIAAIDLEHAGAAFGQCRSRCCMQVWPTAEPSALDDQHALGSTLRDLLPSVVIV